MTTPTNPKRPKRPSPGPKDTPDATAVEPAVEPAGEPSAAAPPADGGAQPAAAAQGGTAAPVLTDEESSEPATARPVTAEDVAAEDVATLSEDAAAQATLSEDPPAAEPDAALPDAAEEAPITRHPELPSAGDTTPGAVPEGRAGDATGTLPPPWRRTLGGRGAESEPASARASGRLPTPTRSAKGSGRLPSASRIPRPSADRFRISDRADVDADATPPVTDPEPPDTGRARGIEAPTLGFRRPPGPGTADSRQEPSQTPGGFPMSWPRGRRPRQASLQLKRFDPWSVLKIALVLAVVVYLVWMVAVGVLYGVLNGIGVWDRLNGQYADLVAEQGGQRLISAGRVFGVAALIGAVNSLLVAVGLSVGAFVYNVAADLVGGIEVTLSERD